MHDFGERKFCIYRQQLGEIYKNLKQSPMNIQNKTKTMKRMIKKITNEYKLRRRSSESHQLFSKQLTRKKKTKKQDKPKICKSPIINFLMMIILYRHKRER